MSRVIQRSFLGTLQYFCRRKLNPKNYILYHDGLKVMLQRSIPLLTPSSAIRKNQQSVFLSQKAVTVSFDDPVMKKYVSDILSGKYDDKGLKKPSFWHDLHELMSVREKLMNNISSLNEIKQGNKDDNELRALAEEEQALYCDQLIDLDNEILMTILPRKAHENYSNIVVEISSGAGGQEAMLFASELLQMYENYAFLRDWTFSVESVDQSDIGGIKSATIFIQGTGSYHYMQNEIGVHRVQRVPVTSTAGMIHTSTAAVIVMPQPTEVDIKLPEKDIEIETMRASGPGGQNVNKSESAVRIKHIPTGLAVESREHKSQHANKKAAMTRLRTKLFDIEIQKQDKEINATRRVQLGNRDRSEKIRTYNFPQNRVTDHRAQVTTHNIKELMEGGNDFHNFMEKLIEQSKKQLISQFISSIKQNT